MSRGNLSRKDFLIDKRLDTKVTSYFERDHIQPKRLNMAWK